MPGRVALVQPENSIPPQNAPPNTTEFHGDALVPEMPISQRHRAVTSAAIGCALILLSMAASSLLSARDLEQWGAVDPSVSNWYKSLMMPDNPTISCCGIADAYYADVFETDGDRYVAVITDARDDGPLGRHHVEPGTRIVVLTEDGSYVERAKD